LRSPALGLAAYPTADVCGLRRLLLLTTLLSALYQGSKGETRRPVDRCPLSFRGEVTPARPPRRPSISPTLSLCLALLSFLIAANFFTTSFINRENYIYYWDYINYWERVTRITDHFTNDPVGMLTSVIHSVRVDDYNDFPAVLLMPVTYLLGNSRLVYILSIVNIFAFAAVASFATLHMTLSSLFGYSSPSLPLIPIGVVSLSPIFWTPILYGSLDVGGLVIIHLILFLYLKSTASEHDGPASFFIALLIPLAILFRRWYAYWAVSFYIALFVEQCASRLLAYPIVIKDYGKILVRVTIQVAISALVLLALAPTFAVRIVTTSYTDIYSAYRSSNSLWDSLARIVDYCGLLAVSVCIAGAVWSISDSTTRRFSILLLGQGLVIFYLFSRTQDFNSHHFYLLLPAMLFFSTLLITRLVMRYGILVMGGVVLVLLLNLLPAFSSVGLWYTTVAPRAFTAIRHPPLVRNDINEIERMLTVLSETLTEPEDSVYVLASSRVLNSSILGAAYLSLNRYRDIAKRILQTRDVDKRDGFPHALLTVRYVIVANPIQYHLQPRDQRVVGIPAELILTGKNIGTSFKRLPYQFNLDDGVECYLYRKVKEFDHSDLKTLSKMLRDYYPERPSIYEITKN